MRHLSISCLSLVFGLAASQSFADSFDLRANAHVGNYEAGEFQSDFQAASLTTVPGSASAASAVSIAGISAYEFVYASLTDAYHGSVGYHYGWDTQTMSPTSVSFGATSGYAFEVTTPSTLTLDWSSAFASTVGDPGGVGIFDVFIYVDGTQYRAPIQWPATSSGQVIAELGTGKHYLDFQNYSNLSGTLGSSSVHFDETLNFSIASPVPEPASIGVLGLGLIGLVRRRKALRA